MSQAVVIAIGVRAEGWREVLGFAVGDSEDGAFWTAFLRGLEARAGAVLVEAHDEWQTTDRHYLSEPPWRSSSRQPRHS